MNSLSSCKYIYQGSEAQQTVSAKTYHELKRRIIYNELPPGFQALEKEIQLTLGVSRTPVREALVRLQDEGLVELIPRHGVRIVPLYSKDIEDIEEVLACLEVEAVRRLSSQKPNEEIIGRLINSITQLDLALDNNDLRAWAEADYYFHRLIISLSGNYQLQKMAQSFLDKAHRFRLLFLPIRSNLVYSNVNHASVIEAIKRGDTQTAQEIHRAHKSRIAMDRSDWIRQLGIINE